MAMPLLETHKLDLVTTSDVREVRNLLAPVVGRSSNSHFGRRERPSTIGKFGFGHLAFSLVDFGGPLEVEVEGESKNLFIISCLRGRVDMQVDGSDLRIDHGDTCMLRPHDFVRSQLSGDCVRLITRIDTPSGRSLWPLRSYIGSEDSELKPWLDQVNCILSSPNMMRLMAHNCEVAAQMETLLVSLLRPSTADRPLGAGRVREIVSRDVRRAELFIRENVQAPITLEDIVVASRVSARTLQNNFKRFRRSSPIQYLRDVRLDLARSRLLDATRPAFVSDVALECGFNHLGRFSSSYRDKFGESPSETLAQASRAPQQLAPRMSLGKVWSS